jgi:hypothetical protein
LGHAGSAGTTLKNTKIAKFKPIVFDQFINNFIQKGLYNPLHFTLRRAKVSRHALNEFLFGNSLHEGASPGRLNKYPAKRSLWVHKTPSHVGIMRLHFSHVKTIFDLCD